MCSLPKIIKHIKNAQPKPKKRRAAHGSEAQNNGGQNNMNGPYRADAAAAASSNDVQPSQAHDEPKIHSESGEIKIGMAVEHEQDDALKAAAILQEERDATMRHTVADMKLRRVQREKREREQAKQVNQVRTIAKASRDCTSGERDPLQLIAENVLDQIPKVEVFEN